jgi:hypothetical protein
MSFIWKKLREFIYYLVWENDGVIINIVVDDATS